MHFMKSNPAQLAVLFAILFMPSSLHAWGREGHEIVAIIAEGRLAPDVREQATMLVEGTPFVRPRIGQTGCATNNRPHGIL